MNCLCCGTELQNKTCSRCGYALREGDNVVSLFAVDTEDINKEMRRLENSAASAKLMQQFKVLQAEVDLLKNLATASNAKKNELMQKIQDLSAKIHQLEISTATANAERVVLAQKIESHNKEIRQLRASVRPHPENHTLRNVLIAAIAVAVIASFWNTWKIINIQSSANKNGQNMASQPMSSIILESSPLQPPEASENTEQNTVSPPQSGSSIISEYSPVQPPQESEGFVFIQGGTFTMGSPASESKRSSDEIQHSVTISSFYMGKYAVTQQKYQEVMGSNPSRYKGDNLPVERVSWYDAVEYCNRRSQQEGFSPAYIVSGDTVTWNRSANGYRLPSEAEWEYACRAGTTTPFSTGNNITTDQANYSGNPPYIGNAEGTTLGKTTPVGSYTPNAWGLYNMHGNVEEWCWDWYVLTPTVLRAIHWAHPRALTA